MRRDSLRSARALLFALVALPAALAFADEPAPLPRIRVSDDGKDFVRGDDGSRVVLVGANYDHDSNSRLIEEYWHDEWETVAEDFREMKALGFDVVRIHLQVERFMKSAEEPNEAELAQLRRLVELAEETGLYLDLTGLGCYRKERVPAWYDALSEADRWTVQARFWKAVAEACERSPAVFCYDLMNEPILPGDEPSTEWLGGELGGFWFVQRISLHLDGRTREEVAKAWIDKMAKAIRSVDDETLITVGVIPWAHVWPGAKPLFHDPKTGENLDFVAVHFYPKSGEVEKALTALAVYDVGKPIVVEEIFALSASAEETIDFIERSRPIADGWISFYWGRTIEENAASSDIAGQITANWLKTFSENVAKKDRLPKNEQAPKDSANRETR